MQLTKQLWVLASLSLASTASALDIFPRQNDTDGTVSAQNYPVEGGKGGDGSYPTSTVEYPTTSSSHCPASTVTETATKTRTETKTSTTTCYETETRTIQ